MSTLQPKAQPGYLVWPTLVKKRKDKKRILLLKVYRVAGLDGLF